MADTISNRSEHDEPTLARDTIFEAKTTAEKCVEGTFTFLLAIIGTLYIYAVWMVIPLYQSLVDSHGQEPLSPTIVGPVLVLTKVVSMVLHTIAPSIGGDSLRWCQIRYFAFAIIALGGLVFASIDGAGPNAILLGLAGLSLTSSRSQSGPLFVAPCESRMQWRTLAYDLASQIGCLWTSSVVSLLGMDFVREHWVLRFVVLAAPIVVAMICWAALPPSSFFSKSMMQEAQDQLTSGHAKPEKVQSVLKEEVLENDNDSLEEARREESIVCMPQKFPTETSVATESTAASSTHISRTPSASDVLSTIKTWEHLSDEEDLPRSESARSELTSPNEAEDDENSATGAWKGSAWRNNAFVLLAFTWALVFWCANFYSYNVLPLLMIKSGISLETVGVMVMVEGLVLNIVMVFVMRARHTYIFEKFFICAVLSALSAMPAVIFTEYCHWSVYMLTLLTTDIVLYGFHILLPTVLLRCVPWNLVSTFYSQVGGICGTLGAMSFIQYSLYELVDWPATILIGHGIPLVGFLCLMIVKRQGFLRIWRDSKVSMERPK
eukprot:TRINITY_DN38370_c0_g1_i1.p1 TRINITY_DN38370_c0_g1~~TRINITY_DN38370_c0_g1_i1.p1  ORF type:complete len:565 (-),score=61.04 TRINITY_DN38370_c0_g1_i1:341-1990(-)